MPELIMLAVGVGVGVGDGDGIGVGVGVGVSVGLGDGDCALAGDKAAIVKARAKASATAGATTRPAPVPFAREGRDEQHMDAIPKSSANLSKVQKILSYEGDLPLVPAEGQSVLVPRRWGLAGIVPLLPQLESRPAEREPDSRTFHKLANARISCCNPQHNRILAVRLCVSRP
jgi:hypothetical protein